MSSICQKVDMSHIIFIQFVVLLLKLSVKSQGMGVRVCVCVYVYSDTSANE